jgi:hypothetical protein
MAHDALYTDSRVYDYDFMVSQPDMKVIHLPDMRAILDKNGQVDRGSIERQGTRETQVTNDYTGRTLQIAPNSTTHSVEGTNKRIVTNGRLGAEAVDLVRHAIPINGLKVQNKNAIGTYAMAALALDDVGNEFVAIITVDQLGKVNNIQFKDIVHSISGRIKRKSLGLTQSHAVRASTHPDTQGFSTISIADFLDIVNSTHQGILSNDVLRHYRAERDMGSYWGSRTQFSLKEGKGEQRNAREVDHIKDQIRRNQDILNTMTSIANSPGYDLSPHDDASRDRILQRLRGYGLRISRQDGITVQLDEDHIRRSWRYVQTREEAEAMMLLPAVIKRGIVLADIEEYKGRPQDSITIGGPVMIGSQRGNMGVVLSRPAGKYFYKATRILSPDGTVFVFGQ